MNRSSTYLYNAPKYCEFEVRNNINDTVEHKIQVDVPKEKIIIDGKLEISAAYVDDLRSVLKDALGLVNLDIKICEEENNED